MKNSIRISVKEPCSKQFKNFSPTAKGGFCGSCQKEVIDFTSMSDSALVNYLNNHSKTCGRFKEGQLKTYNDYVINKNSNNFLARNIGLMGVSLLSLCAVNSLQAQEKPIDKTEINSQHKLDTNTISTEKKIISGTVVDEEDIPLIGVHITVKGTTESISTDFDGHYIFPKAIEANAVLIFSYIGYESKEYTVSESNRTQIKLNITLDLSEPMLMGEVVIEGTYKSKKNIFQKLTGIFK